MESESEIQSLIEAVHVEKTWDRFVLYPGNTAVVSVASRFFVDWSSNSEFSFS